MVNYKTSSREAGATYHVQEVLVAGRHDGGWMSEERCFNSVHMTVGIGLGCFMRTVGGELEKLLIAEFAEVWCTGHPISASEIGAYCSGGRLAGKIPHDLTGCKDEQCPVKMPCYGEFLGKNQGLEVVL